MPRHPMSDAPAPKKIRYRRGLNHTLCRLGTCMGMRKSSINLREIEHMNSSSTVHNIVFLLFMCSVSP